MRVFVKIGLQLARRRSSQARWRRWSIGIASAFVLLALGTTASLTSAASLREAVFQTRIPEIVGDGDRFALRMLEYGPIIEGRQFPIYWIEPGSMTGQLPPGVSTLPDPGTAVISPGLGDLGVDEIERNLGIPLMTRSGQIVTITSDGLVSPAEFLVYARPPADRQLPADRSVEVVGFGAEQPETAIGSGYPPDTASSVLFGGLLLLVVPSIYLLWLAVGAQHSARNRRVQILYDLGVRKRGLRVLIFAEAAISSASLVLTATAIWWFLSTRLAGFPAAGLPFFAGDLRPVWWWLILLPCLTVAMAGSAAVIQAARPQRRGPKYGHRSAPPFVRGVPLVAIALCLSLVSIVEYPLASQIWYLGLVIALVGFPMMLPLFVEWMGSVFARSATAGAWLAGSRLTHRSSELARAALAVGGFIMIATIATAVSARVWTDSAIEGDPDPPAIALSWHDGRPDDLQRLRSALPDAAVLAIGNAPDGDLVLIASSCDDVLPLVPGEECSSDSSVPAGAADVVRAAIRRNAVIGELVVSPSYGLQPEELVTDVLILQADASGRELYEQVLPVAHEEVAVANLTGGAFPQFSERPRRAGAGVMLAGLILLLSSLHTLGERSLALGDENQTLRRLGAHPKLLRTVTWMQISVPGTVAAVVGGTIGIGFAYIGTNIARPETALVLPLLLAEVLGTVILTIVLGALVARADPGSSEPEQANTAHS